MSARAAITKYYRLRGLNNRYLFLMVLEAETPKIKVPADSKAGEGSSSYLADGCLLTVSSHGGERALVSLPLLIRVLIPS